MTQPSERVLELHRIKNEGTYEEALKADAELTKLAKQRMEEEKKNPPPWGDIMF